MQAAILVGGLGTRLGQLVRERPKPLLEIAGKPFLEHVIWTLKRHGIRDIVLFAGYRAEVVEQLYGPGSDARARLGVDIRVVVESEPLGTGGALVAGKHALADRFLLLNGDSLLIFNYLDLMLRDARDSSEPLVTIALRRVPDARRYGVIDVAAGRVVGFREKPEQPGPGTVNGGVYWVDKTILDSITATPCSLERDVLPGLIASGRVRAKEYDGYFIDIGTPQDFTRAGAELAAVLKRPAVFFDRDNTLIRDKGYTFRNEDLQWLPGVPQMIKKLNDANVLVFVVTNQAGVAKGHYDEPAIRAFHSHLASKLAEVGAHVDAWRYCPHHAEGTVAAYKKECDWRKPGPGMLLDLLRKWPVDAARSLVIGDQEHDVLAGQRAGLPARLAAPGGAVQEVDSFLAGLAPAA